MITVSSSYNWNFDASGALNPFKSLGFKYVNYLQGFRSGLMNETLMREKKQKHNK